MNGIRTTKKGLKICSGITALFHVSLLVALIVLCLTVLRPKEPKITAQNIILKEVKWQKTPKFSVNISMEITITVHNPNQGSFKYMNSPAYVSYGGKVVAKSLILEDEIPSRGKQNLSTTVEIDGDGLRPVARFSGDLLRGCFNFTSSATFVGKVSFLKLFRIKATGFSSCGVSVLLRTHRASSSGCISEVNF
ncbi:hypothetical protein Nepgr_032120 [Nepenthes gracilis]|uniref:Late embryogenesis abundant protein LEA-2 subgroup domain-containing protein n=1 Tax=Nepenthes gracilis TaxID=150966 RepID=A0AAD3TIV4_NEPGR|nr:hypothetical protein Nepgr_032120 [Nepenthes gracilis]